MKSNKKLFAILTLVVFMMTLLPMAAFAAASVPTAGTVVVDKNAQAATGVSMVITFTVPLTGAGDTVTLDFTDSVPAAAAVLAGGAANAAGSSAAFTGAIQAGNSQIILTTAAGAAAGTYTQVITGLTNLAADTYSMKVGATTLATYTVYAANQYASSYTVDQTTISATGTDKAVIEIFAASGGAPVSGKGTIVTTNRGNAIDPVTAHADYATGLTSTAGKVKKEVASTTKGTAKLAVALEANAYPYDPDGAGSKAALASVAAHTTAIINYLNGDTTYNAADLLIVGSVTNMEFVSPSATGIALTADAGSTVADGVTEKSIIATVTGTNGVPVMGATVEFVSNKTGISFDKTSYTTDAFGKATAKATTATAGTYTITARTGGKEATANYAFAASGTGYAVTIFSGNNQTTANTYASSKMKVKVTDINGNTIKSPTVEPLVDWELKSKPTGSSLSTTKNAAFWAATELWDADNSAVYNTFTPDKIGTYVVRASLANGKYVEFTVESKEQGTVTKMTMSYDQKTLGIPNGVSSAPTVKWVDDAGVSRDATLASLTFAISNQIVASVDTGGATPGVVRVLTTDTKKAQTVSVTAVDSTRNLVATASMDLVTAPVGMTLTADKATAAVGDSFTVTIQLVDENGKAVALPYSAALTPDVKILVVSKPSAATLDTSVAGNKSTTLEQTGATTFTAKSVVAGEYVIQVTVQDDAAAPTKYYTAGTTLKFGAAKAAVGAKAVTMFIGATGFVQDGTAKVNDVAPFIQDGRTFVAVRPIADAFGAEIGWNEATQTVTLTRSDMTLTIVIGSNTITKVSGGVTSTSTADVAAFIKDGRTVLPFRAVGEAFGATVSYDAATQAVSFTQ